MATLIEADDIRVQVNQRRGVTVTVFDPADIEWAMETHARTLKRVGA